MNTTRFLGFAVLLTCTSLLATNEVTAQEDKTRFATPVVLKAGDEVINKDGKMMYPSPAIFDVDRDGQSELVIGTIFGQVYACENENGSMGDPVWSKPEPVETTDGEPLKLNNW